MRYALKGDSTLIYGTMSYEIHKRIEVKYGPLKISNKSCLAEKSKFYTRKEGCTWKKCSAA